MYLIQAIIYAITFADIIIMITGTDQSDNCTSSDIQATAECVMKSKDQITVLQNLLAEYSIEQCQKLNAEYSALNNGVPLIPEDYVPHESTDCVFEDLEFAYTFGPQKMKLALLKALFLEHPDGDYDIILMEILIIDDQNKAQLIDVYNHFAPLPMIESVKYGHKDDVGHFLEELVTRIRDNNDVEPNKNEVDDFVSRLNDERKSKKGWEDTRKVLDEVLMNKCPKFALAVIAGYADSNNGNTLRDDIMKKLGNEHLEFGYTSLIDVLQDRFTYIATRIHDSYHESKDYLATWILYIVGTYGTPEWEPIRDAYTKKYNEPITNLLSLWGPSDPVSQSILKRISKDEPKNPSPS